MRSTLLTKEGINAPAAIDPDFDAQILKAGIKINYVTRNHRSTPDQGRRLRPVDAQKTYLPNYGLAITAFSL
jgi:hypothetical protein